MVDHAQQRAQRQVAIGETKAFFALAAVEHGRQQLLELLALPSNLAPLRAPLEDVTLLLEDEHVVAVELDVRYPRPDDLAQLLVR